VLSQIGAVVVLPFALSIHQRSVRDTLDTGLAETLEPICLILGIVSRKEEPLRISLTSKNVRSNTIKEIAIMRNYHCATRKVQQPFLKGTKGIGI
jgi:hypothetical protein